MNNNYVWVLVILYLTGCQPTENKDESVIIDITQATKTKSIFGEGVISTALYERDMAISPQLDEIIYTLGDYKQKQRCLVGMKYENGHWTKPKILNISGEYQDIEPFLSDNGNTLYFASNRPIFGDDSRKDYNIWYCNRNENTWSEPTPLDSIINTKKDEGQE